MSPMRRIVIERSRYAKNVLAQVTELNGMGMPQLKERWKALFDTEPPARTARTWSSAWRTASRSWPTAGCRSRPMAQLREIAEEHEKASNRAAGTAPSPGTRLVREWNGERYEVTVTRDGYEYRGRPFKSLSAIARDDHRHPLERAALLRHSQAGGGRLMQKTVVRPVRCAIYTRKSTEEGSGQRLQLARRPARGGRGLRRQPAERGMGAAAGPLRRRRVLRRQSGAPGLAAALARRGGWANRLHRGLQGGPPEPVADGLLQARGSLRPAEGLLRLRDAAFQHHRQHGPADAEYPAVLRPVRAGDHRRAHPRQDRRREEEGQTVRRNAGARIRPGERETRGQSDGGEVGPAHLRFVPADRLDDDPGPAIERAGACHEDMDDAQGEGAQRRRVEQGALVSALPQPHLPWPGDA